MNLDRRTALAALAAAGLLWGTTVPVTKLALQWLPPGWLTVARFGLAAAVLLAAVGFRVRGAASPAVLAWGAVGYGGSILVQNAGITRTSVSHAALLIGATPVLVAVIAALRHRSVAPPVAWTGFAVSFAGVGLVAAGGGGGASFAGDGLVLASLGFSALFTVAQARLLPGRDPVAVTAVQFLAAALTALPVAVVTEGTPPAAAGAGPVLATAGLVLFGTLAAATLFAYGQARVSAEVAGSFVNLEPLVGAAAGAAVFGDPVGIAQAAGAAAILTGIALGSLPLLRAGPRSPGQASIAVLAETPCDQLPPQAVARLRDRVYAALHQGSVRQWAARSPWQGGRYPSAHAVEVEGREMTGEAVACTTEQALLGEGPRWDTRRGELLWVDILAGRVHRDRVADDGALLPVASYQVPGTVGAVAPVQDDPGWLLAAGRGFAHLSVDGTVRPLAEEVAPAGTRMNDAACDPQGRFWAGTKADAAGAAALYRFDGNGRTEVVLEGLTISNGLGWSLDSATMYLADSHPGVIHAFAFDADQGRISDGRVLVELPEEVGVPDGLTVDADGDLWVAIWGGGRVHRYAPDGELRQTLAVPADQSTSCAFAGPGLHRLYVTTATEDWSEEQRRADPMAGLVYRFDTGATGLPAAPFRPDPAWWATRTRRPAPG